MKPGHAGTLSLCAAWQAYMQYCMCALKGEINGSPMYATRHALAFTSRQRLTKGRSTIEGVSTCLSQSQWSGNEAP